MSSATSDAPAPTADARRLRRLGESLERLNADAVLVAACSSRQPDLASLIGNVHLGASFVVASREGEVRLGFETEMERDEAASTGIPTLGPGDLEPGGGRTATSPGRRSATYWELALERLGLDGGRLAIAGALGLGSAAEAIDRLRASGWEIVPADQELLGLRKEKGPWELTEIRRAAAGVTAAMRAVAETLVDLHRGGSPPTAGRLRDVVARTLGDYALDQPEGNIVSIGAEAAVPHTQGADNRALRPGESLVVDLYPKGHLFADCTRTFCLGAPPGSLAAAHALVHDALGEAARLARPGVDGCSLQEIVCDRFEAAGYPTNRSAPGTRAGYVHGLGHGVGFELHELPSFRPGTGLSGRLAPGDVFTLEPGLYDPETGYGVRLENLYLMTDDGPELLTPLPYALDPRDW